MSPSEPPQEPAAQLTDAPASRPSYAKRLWRRVMYMLAASCPIGAVLGQVVDGFAGAAIGLAAGAVVGVFLGVVIGGYAWVLESPLKGAIRGGGLFAATMGLLLLILLLANQGWGGWENALSVALMTAGMGAVVGALLGAILAWLAGDIFCEIVEQVDRGESPGGRRA
jgi:hypothetical protein